MIDHRPQPSSSRRNFQIDKASSTGRLSEIDRLLSAFNLVSRVVWLLTRRSIRVNELQRDACRDREEPIELAASRMQIRLASLASFKHE